MTRRADYAPRTSGPGSGRRAPSPAHRVQRTDCMYAAAPHTLRGEYGQLGYHIERCRCGAWRARVYALGAVLVTDWSAPCSTS